MRQDVKELIDAMEKGWKMLPVMSDWYFKDQHGIASTVAGKLSNISAACAQGHALIGVNCFNAFNRVQLFPILEKQWVSYGDRTFPLASAINKLVILHRWTTPQVIEWLRSHLED